MGSDPGSGRWTSGSSERRTVVGSRTSGPPPDSNGHPAIHVGVRQPRPRSRGRHQANPTASLWSVPILADRQAAEDDVVPFRVQTERALAPRYARRAASPLLFFLSARGSGDRVWGFETTAFEITKGAEGHLVETPAPAPDGSRVAVVVKEAGHRHLAVMNQDGQGSQTLAVSH